MTQTLDIVTIISAVGAIIGVLVGLSKLNEAKRTWSKETEQRAKETESRFVKLEVMTGTMWDVFLGDAKAASRRAGFLQASSPERNSPLVTAQLVQSGLGPRIRALYDELRREDPQLTESNATWRFYAAFKEEWEPKLMTPLGMNLSQALVAAWRFCVDGGEDG